MRAGNGNYESHWSGLKNIIVIMRILKWSDRLIRPAES